MVGEPAQHACPDHSGADRLSLVADMLSNAVALLHEAMEEIKSERGQNEMTVMLPAHLTETLNNLGDAAKALTSVVEADREQRIADAKIARDEQKRYNRRTMGLLVLVAILVGGLVFISIANRRLGVANSELNRQNSRIVERIESCTTAGGECYEQSRKNTNNIAEQLLRANVAVAICARTESDPDAIEACVLARVSAPSEAEEPPPSGTDPNGVPVVPEPAETP